MGGKGSGGIGAVSRRQLRRAAEYNSRHPFREPFMELGLRAILRLMFNRRKRIRHQIGQQ